MRWRNVKWILLRETRDQLRDRRTLFMISVLPLLLYPLVGMAFLQMAQFLREHPSRVLLIGANQLPLIPPLVVDGQFAEGLLPAVLGAESLELTCADLSPQVSLEAEARRVLSAAEADVVVYLPAPTGLSTPTSDLVTHPSRDQRDVGLGPWRNPQWQPRLFYHAARDRSRVAHDRLWHVMTRWRQQLSEPQATAVAAGTPTTPAGPLRATDVASSVQRRNLVWSKILPFILMVWALTGAFYPAVDLCAGEKERGTLETLLSSPARRGEIVWGKLLTVMLFSMATSVLNLASMLITSTLVANRLAVSSTQPTPWAIGVPPWSGLGWLLVALVPVAALFSALSLALAAQARSTKEGQYYLLPLLILAMPLLILPVLPGVELELGTSLIPLTGMLLLLRKLMEGEHLSLLRFAVPVLVATGISCGLAIRWAIDQFNDERVLFRESERFQPWRELCYRLRHRREMPLPSLAITCGMLILIGRFLLGLLLPAPTNWWEFSAMTMATMVGLIAAVPTLLAVLFTKRPWRCLGLSAPPDWSMGVAVLLALALHPWVVIAGEWVRDVYPAPDGIMQGLQGLLSGVTANWQLFWVLALVPAICEELAFRGFLLSGLRAWSRPWRAIVVSSVFFGLAHGVIQQSVMATLLGLVLGFMAFQSRSIWPAVAFHATHNSLLFVGPQWLAQWQRWYPQLDSILSMRDGQYQFHWSLLLMSAVGSLTLLAWFRGVRAVEGVADQPALISHHGALPAAPSIG